MRDPELDASLAAVDTATTKLGAGVATVSTAVDAVSIRFDALKDSIKTNMTPAEVAAVKEAIDADTTKLDTAASALDSVVEVLNGIGADPAEPVPEPVPEVPPIE